MLNLRAVIYARVSTDKQELENQLMQLRRYCVKCGYDVVKEYCDIITGKRNNRPMYDAMFLDAHRRVFDVVVFWDLSRFSRSGTLFTLQKLRELENLSIEWESYQEPYFKSVGDFKDVILSIIATIAKIERVKISERTKAGLVNAKNVGKRGKDRKPRKRAGYYGVKKRGG